MAGGSYTKPDTLGSDMAKATIGDVIEIPTRDGRAYAQYTHFSERYGELIRVLPGVYEEQPDLAELVREEEVFWTFCSLNALIADGDVMTVVAHEPVPERARRFPTFKHGRPHPDTGRVEVWWLWDGEREWRVDALDSEQQRYSVSGIISHPVLVERIESGWRPEHWGDSSGETVSSGKQANIPPPVQPEVRFYLYVASESVAWEVSELLVPQGCEVDVDPEPGGERWLACAWRTLEPSESLDRVDREMEDLARRVGGEYDGHEVNLQPR